MSKWQDDFVIEMITRHYLMEEALSKNPVIYHRGERGERRVRRVLRPFQSLLSFMMPLRSSRALR